MSTWEALVARGAAAPSEFVDSEVRYLLIAPLVAEAALWVDLGCGTGDAAARAVAPGDAPRILLVDRDEDVLVLAAGALGPSRTQTLRADLETREGTDAVRAAVRDAGGGPVIVSCLDVLHELRDMTTVIELLTDLGTDATVVLSAPEDAAGASADPRRESAWSSAAVEELRRTLPAGTRQFTQVALRGSLVVERGVATAEAGETLAVDAAPPAVHHLLAFGPGAATLRPISRTRPADLAETLAATRRRESDLAYLEARVEELEARTS